ncbi:MAG: hypothetical protein JWN14_3204 [Chthonomonadales bacterium]|nr:hypothetical protein [Chthonomonadales bacterium]
MGTPVHSLALLVLDWTLSVFRGEKHFPSFPRNTPDTSTELE